MILFRTPWLRAFAVPVLAGAALALAGCEDLDWPWAADTPPVEAVPVPAMGRLGEDAQSQIEAVFERASEPGPKH